MVLCSKLGGFQGITLFPSHHLGEEAVVPSDLALGLGYLRGAVLPQVIDLFFSPLSPANMVVCGVFYGFSGDF